MPVAQSQLDLVVVSGLDCRLPRTGDALTVVGMDRRNPAFAERSSLGESRVVVPIRVAINESAIWLCEPDDLWRQLQQILEPASGGNRPTFKLRRGQRDEQDEHADNGNDQTELVCAEHQTGGRAPVSGSALKAGRRHAGVVHPHDREPKEQCRTDPFEPGSFTGARVDEIPRDGESDERGNDCDRDRRGDDDRIVPHGGAAAHSCHTGIMHAGD